MKRILVTLAFVTVSHFSFGQTNFWDSIAHCYTPVFDSMGNFVYILTSDREKWRELKPGQRVPAFSRNFEYNGYYLRGKNGNYEFVREEQVKIVP